MHKFVSALLCTTCLLGVPLSDLGAKLPEGGGRTILPPPEQSFTGRVAPNAAESTPAFPPRLQAPAGAPNILLVMTDDVGFAASSTFGGLIPTPALDQLAARGLKYNNFHTAAMCSPSRAALLTGRNHHVAGTGLLSDLATGFPGYFGEIPKSTATIAEVLRQNGYSTAMFGKHHNVPQSEISPNGPFSNWPLGLGFEHFLGFIGSQTDQWNPALIRDNSRTPAPAGEHLDQILATDAIRWIQNQKAGAPDKPFFIYLAPGSAHAPLQAPATWIAKFKGKFDQGWDRAREEIFTRQKAAGVVPSNAVLSERPSYLPAWNSLTRDQQRVAARFMEVYAAQLAFQDDQFGRIIAELRRMGQLDNTLIIFIEGDNGPSAEGGLRGTTNDTGLLVNAPPEPDSWLLDSLDRLGGPAAHAHYPLGWAWAMTTPFRYFKRYASHLGGTRNGMVLSWPKRLQGINGVRTQFQHLIDIAPTILEAAGVPSPSSVNGVAQRPLDGQTFSDTFKSTKIPGHHRVQYFELLGNRAIYQDGWMASTTPQKMPVDSDPLDGKPASASLPAPQDYPWELYDLKSDFSQVRDLAQKNPEKLKEMRALWMKEAQRNQVFPLDNTLTAARASAESRARVPARSTYIYWGEGVELERGNVAPILYKSFVLNATVTTASESGDGVIASFGDNFGGWSFYLKDGRPVVAEAFSDQPQHQYRLEAKEKIPSGQALVSYEVRYSTDSPGLSVRIKSSGRIIGSGEFPHRVNMVDQGESFAIGRDTGNPVTSDYRNEGRFSGTIEKVEIDFGSAPPAPPAGTAKP